MARMVCINLPAPALQLLIQRRPRLREVPTAVLDENGRYICERNRAAAGLGIDVGLRYGAALSRAPNLHLEKLQPSELAAAQQQVVSLLYRLSDRVEQHAEEYGVYWVGTRGLLHAYDGVQDFCRKLQERLAAAGWAAAVAAGHTHFGAYVAAKRGLELGAVSAAVERRAVQAVGLDILGLPAETRRRLERLAVRSIAEFLRLPEKEIELRFGARAGAAYRLAAGSGELPVRLCTEAAERRLRFVPAAPLRRLEDLYLELRPHLGKFLAAAAARGELVPALHLGLELEDGAVRRECIRPAEAGRELALFERLLRLRLEGSEFSSPIEACVLEGEFRLGVMRSLELFPSTPRRSTEAEQRAYSFLRARFGDAVLGFAVAVDAYLPEQCFRWSREKQRHNADAESSYRPVVVRRLLCKPRPFRRAGPVRPGAPGAGASRGVPDAGTAGPYIVTGEWWRDSGSRSYYYLRGKGRRVLWVYFDTATRSWVLHGGL